MTTRRLLTTGEAARREGVHPSTVGLWVRTGRLPAVPAPGSHWHLIDEDDLDAFLAERRARTERAGAAR